MSKITTEMDLLEKEKQKFQHLSKLHDLKIKKIKALQNLDEIESEIAKLGVVLDRFQGAKDLLNSSI